MRNFLFILIFSLSQFCFSQEKIDLKTYYLSENGNLISEHFNDKVDINFGVKQLTMEKNQAKVVLEKYFNNQSFTTYKSNHQGGGNGRPFFEIGNLTSAKQTYRTYMLYKLNEDQLVILELRIEEEK